MPNGMVQVLLEGVVSSVIASVAYALYSKITDRAGREPVPTKQYSKRLAELTASLTKASAEVDAILKELAEVAQKRETAVSQLESNISAMEASERELKDRIEMLEKTPLPVAEYLTKFLESDGKRSARRDYLLFGAGVIMTTAIDIVMRLLRIG